MHRRKFLQAGTLGGAASALGAPALAQNRRTLTMVTTWERGADGVHDAAQHAADSISQMSDGAVTVDLKAAGELVHAYDVFDTVTSGQVDMYHGPDYWFTAQHPAYAFFTTVPFGMTAAEMATWYYQDGGRELHDRLGDIFNLKSFLAGNTGAQAGGWYRRLITGPEDFQGLRIRMPGLGGKVMMELGAEVITLPGAEVYEALRTGAIDATEWVGPWADERAGLGDLVSYYYPAGFHEPAGGLTLAVNRDVYDGLIPAHQRIIEIASAETHQWSLAQYLSQNGRAMQRMARSRLTLAEFPADVWDAFGTAAAQIHQEHLVEPLYSEVYDSYRRSMRATSRWLSASEMPYRTQRDRLMG
ncbi:ABC transporter substrate-binding protein [Rhodobacteraceae bacterium 2CG4]|uniref:ABC transporter substrate-binding protein n=1 Tax=Halovulum marinum TaxID=2662447 RepID=A0A6L5Z313_9RHOB|nr:TRAP transporter substrate-binding protein [Halovulum marinum]MSU90981.1 ABC transporter substrate-binding protein [Halovulum marinum]